MNEVAAWLAPAATMIAAMMTAANLGARVTGWGFVVFAVGSIAWCVVALGTGQTNLLATNGFLAIVNVIGIWRWLGREARYGDDGKAVAEQSKQAARPTLIPGAKFVGAKIRDGNGRTVAEIVDTMIGTDGALHSLLIRHGGVGGICETVSILDCEHVTLHEDFCETELDADAVGRLPPVDQSK